MLTNRVIKTLKLCATCASFVMVFNVFSTFYEHPSPKTKYILFWNPYFTSDYYFGFGQEPFIKAGCPIYDCNTTDDRNALPVEDFDAVLFHGYPFPAKNDLPTIRRSRQRYVLFLMEPPQSVIGTPKQLPSHRLQGFFNWTITYLRESDVIKKYGYVAAQSQTGNDSPGLTELSKSAIETQKLTKVLQTKKKLVAWFVSNCNAPSKRQDYVKELQKYIPVDVYGKCGKFKCKDKTECYSKLEREYWFYLSFENSLCADYVTEKFFNILKYNVVPVVYGGANYSEFAPPDSFIDVRHFRTPSDLAKRLQELAYQTEEYVKFFSWKQHFKVIDQATQSKEVFCNLCAKLHSSSPEKVYEDIEDWWGVKRRCYSPESHSAMGFLSSNTS